MNVEKPRVRIMCLGGTTACTLQVQHRTEGWPGRGGKDQLGAEQHTAGEKEELRADSTKRRRLRGHAGFPWSALPPCPPDVSSCPPCSRTCKDKGVPTCRPARLQAGLGGFFPPASNHSFMYASIYSANVY